METNILSVPLTIFVVGDGDGDDVPLADHGAAPVVPGRRPQVNLELFFGLKHRVVVHVNRAVLHLAPPQKHTEWLEKVNTPPSSNVMFL